MSIQSRILVPTLTLVAVATIISAVIGLNGLADHRAMAVLTGKAIQAGAMIRKAHDDFTRIGDLAADVTMMTHFIDTPTIEKNFRASDNAVEADLASLKAAALSPRMDELAQNTIDKFRTWRDQVQVVLGLTQGHELVQNDILKRDADVVVGLLNNALALSGLDAEAMTARAGDDAKRQTIVLLSLAASLALAGTMGAFWLARTLSRPLKSLVLNAERLASGDTTVKFLDTARNDEIGEISRAVAGFLDNVMAAKRFEADAAASREAGEAARDRSAAERTKTVEAQTEVVRRLSEGLVSLAAGDLTVRVNDGFSGSYMQIKNDFNAALDKLKATMQAVVSSAKAIKTGAHDISAASVDLSKRTEQQAARLEKTAGTLDEITATVKRSADNAAEAKQVVSTAETDAKQSATIVRQAVSAMAGIENSASQIKRIIDVIDEIAFQTNLLALNAGVEAARAGETGRGFAVVALEVRALAQRCAEAAKEIKVLISTSTTQVEEGVKLVGATGASLDRILHHVSQMNTIVAQLADSAKLQAAGLAEVNTAVNQMDQVTQQNAAMVEQNTTASRALADETEGLARLVAQFEVGRHDAPSMTARLPAHRSRRAA